MFHLEWGTQKRCGTEHAKEVWIRGRIWIQVSVGTLHLLQGDVAGMMFDASG